MRLSKAVESLQSWMRALNQAREEWSTRLSESSSIGNWPRLWVDGKIFATSRMIKKAKPSLSSRE